MVYLKSLVAGLLSVIVASVALFVIVIIGLVIYTAVFLKESEGSAGWDPISLTRQPTGVIAFFVAVFCIGFIWKYRHMTR